MARKSRSVRSTARIPAAKTNDRATAKDMLGGLAERLEASANLRTGDIVFHLSGVGGGEFRLTSRAGKTSVSSRREPEDRKPLIEIWGDANVIRSIISREKNAVKQFMVGGIRIRGDLRYFSDLALELGILEAPL
jgi:SCP-2 sterol transfer family